MGDTADANAAVRRHHGRHPGSESTTPRSATPARVPRRDLKATDHRDARADPGETWPTRPPRLRIRTQWDGQSVHDVRAAGRLAACQGHRPPHRDRLCPRAQGTIRHGTSPIRRKSCLCRTTSTPTSYEAFPPAEARRLVERFEWHYTPKHGSWPTWPNSELGVLASQCLNRRIADKQVLSPKSPHGRTTATSTTPRPTGNSTTADARVKLKRLYPQFE